MTIEPRVEDLLATIRKAIDDDLGPVGSSTSEKSQGTLMRGALREMRVSFDAGRGQADSEISKLRDRIGRSRIEATISAPMLPLISKSGAPPREPQTGFTTILGGNLKPEAAPPALRQSVHDDDQYQMADPDYGPEYSEPEYVEPEPQAYYQQEPYQRGALVSPQAAYAAQSSFQNLADTIMARATSERSLEEMTSEILRGMVKTWLDNNLPDLVERLVRDEIERVARRGR